MADPAVTDAAEANAAAADTPVGEVPSAGVPVEPADVSQMMKIDAEPVAAVAETVVSEAAGEEPAEGGETSRRR